MADPTSYQRVNTATDYDETVGVFRLKFDGVDDFLKTASIDFTATDKMTVVAGVTKLAAAEGVISELSSQFNLNIGSFDLQARATDECTLFVRGNAATTATSKNGFGVATPAVVTAETAIAASHLHEIRVNASAATPVTTNVGNGNFGNYPLYIGRRNGTSHPFNGEWSSLVVRGAASTTDEIEKAEAFAANLHGVTL